MAYPPPVPPANRTNATVMATNHPSDHNLISGALTEILNHIAPLDTTTATNGCKWVVGQTFPGGGITTSIKPQVAGDVTVNTGGYMDAPTSNFMRMQGLWVYAVSCRVQSQSVLDVGADLVVTTSDQGALAVGRAPGGTLFTAGFTTSIGSGATVQFNVTNYGAAFFASCVCSCFRVSI